MKIGDIDSLSSEQQLENARNLDAIESLDDIYKTYRPRPMSYYQRSSSTSTLKGGENVEYNESHTLQETVAKTNIKNVATVKFKAEEKEQKASKNVEENEKNYKTTLAKKATPPPIPPRPSRTPDTSTSEEIERNLFKESDRDKYFEMRIASGEMPKMQTQVSEDQLENSIESQYSYSTTPMQPQNVAKLMNGANSGQEMIASDYYAQQLAMQISNPLYSYGGYGQSQLLSGMQGYQLQSPESEYYNYAQLQGQLQSISSYGQYSSPFSYAQTDSSNFSQYMQYPHMAGGGGGHTSSSAEERNAKNTDSTESGSCNSESTENQSGCQCFTRSGNPCGMEDNANARSAPETSCTCSSEGERCFEMPDSMPSMPQCRVGAAQCPMRPQSRFSFVDMNPNYDVCPMEMPSCGGMPPPCALPRCMFAPPTCCCPPPQLSPPPPPPQCCPMSYCAAPAPPPPPTPPCCSMSCCSPNPECCACSGNCLNVDGFIQRIRAAQQQASYANSCSDSSASCCGDDRLQSKTVYATDYQPFCGCGNNFNHFPLAGNCRAAATDSTPLCMPPLCCPSPCRSPQAGCCSYELPCCTLPMPSGCCLPSPFPATCGTPCFAPCSVPCLSNCPAPCNDCCYANCPMPQAPCCTSSFPAPCNAATQCPSAFSQN